MMPKIVSVYWIDSASHPYWQDEEEVFSALNCHTVGFLIKENDEILVIAQSYAIDKSAKPWADVIVIPKVSVKSQEVLKDYNIQ